MDVELGAYSWLGAYWPAFFLLANQLPKQGNLWLTLIDIDTFYLIFFLMKKHQHRNWCHRKFCNHDGSKNKGKHSASRFVVTLSPYTQWVPQLFERLEFFHWNKSCKIECCGNKTHQIIQNMILSRGLEVKLSLSWRTTILGQHPLFQRWVQKVKSVWTSAPIEI